MGRVRRIQGCDKRRGTTLILTVFTMFVLFSFLAFSVDTGFLAGAKAEMRRSADAASLAGCWEMYQQLKQGTPAVVAQSAARQSAAQYATANRVNNAPVQADAGALSQEIQVGYLANLTSGAAPSQNATYPFLAVQVSLLKSPQRNGEVPFFFGRIFGKSGQTMRSTSTSVMAYSIDGFSLPPGSDDTIDVLPFALDLQSWTSALLGAADDDYAYNEASGTVTSGSDGKVEVNLYPQGIGSPGNRGTVDIGGANNSTADIARQIVDGISADDLNELGKPLRLDSDGTLTLNGDTGISAGVKDELASIIGQTRIIPIFSTVSGNGNNAQYRIVRWAAVRILDVRLTGPMSNKMVMVQPATMITRNVLVSDASGSSDGLYSPVVLAR